MKKFLLVFVAVIALSQSAPDGIKRLRPSTRVSNGASVTIEDQSLYAHQVYLNSVRKDGTASSCGGVLISSTFVLTAAHCFKSDKIYGLLWFGILERTDRGKDNIVQRKFFPQNFFTYSDWKSKVEGLRGDIALIQITEPVPLVAGKIAVMPLPTQNLCNTNLQGKSAVISGWGRKEDAINLFDKFLNHFFKETHPNNLQYGNVVIQNCEDHELSNDYLICAAGLKNEYACSGDSGGPMIYTDEQLRRYVVGVTSFGKGPCGANTLNAYTRICPYMQWVDEIMGNGPV